jgi:hypothetical protein
LPILTKGKKNSLPENPAPDMKQDVSPLYTDGPLSPLFVPLDIAGNLDLSKIDASMVSVLMAESGQEFGWFL